MCQLSTFMVLFSVAELAMPGSLVRSHVNDWTMFLTQGLGGLLKCSSCQNCETKPMLGVDYDLASIQKIALRRTL